MSPESRRSITSGAASVVSAALVAVLCWVLIVRERDAREQFEQRLRDQGEASRRVTCSLVVAQDNVYREAPPTTEAGRKAAEAWRTLRIRFQCDRP